MSTRWVQTPRHFRAVAGSRRYSVANRPRIVEQSPPWKPHSSQAIQLFSRQRKLSRPRRRCTYPCRTARHRSGRFRTRQPTGWHEGDANPSATTPNVRLASVLFGLVLPRQLATHYKNLAAARRSGQAVGFARIWRRIFPQRILAAILHSGEHSDPAYRHPGQYRRNPTNSKDGAEGEVMLDIEVVAGACPKAKIVVYFANWSERRMDHDPRCCRSGPDQQSRRALGSWGSPEDTDIWTAQAMEPNSTRRCRNAAQIGVTVCVAAGMNGSQRRGQRRAGPCRFSLFNARMPWRSAHNHPYKRLAATRYRLVSKATPSRR